MKKLKAENIELSGNMATVTLSAPFSMIGVDRLNAALQDNREPEVEPQDDQGENQDGLVKKESRFISAVIVDNYYCPFDLTKEGVLKAALPMFKGLGLYKDHHRSVDNNIGAVMDCYYDDTSKPPGINGWACIDRELDPLSAIRLERGYVTRFSITLSFSWEKSHKMNDDAFYEALGDVIDNELVRLIVTKITSITEVSLVYYGADPNAKALSRDSNQNKNYALISRDKEVNKVDEEIKKLLEAALKREIATDVQYTLAVRDALTELEKVKTDNQALETQVAELQAAKEFQDTVTQALRDDVLADASKVGMGKAKARDEMLIKQADYDGLLELKKDFQEELESMFPGERRSSVELEAPKPKETENNAQEANMGDLHQ